ncbi:MAG: O-methyltransferase [Deinococcota bacterium]
MTTTDAQTTLQPTWSAVDTYFCDRLSPEDDALQHALQTSEAAGLPAYNVAPNQGKLLQMLVELQGARRVLELGTLGGYSTIWLARGLPEDGELVTIEASPDFAEVATSNLNYAGLSDKVEVRVGQGKDVLAELIHEEQAPFDVIFIDADKPNNPVYLELSLKLARPGSLIIADNVVRDGAVADATSDDPKVIGVRTFTDRVAANPRLSATALQTVGSKGYDGVALIRVLS